MLDLPAKTRGIPHHPNFDILEDGLDGILLGDAGYLLCPFLVTPFPNPDTRDKKSIFLLFLVFLIYLI